MLLMLENAVIALLKSALSSLFTGEGAVGAVFPFHRWEFDPLSADPVAGEPGPGDAMDSLPFLPSGPWGPYTLTRPPYPGPKRVYLCSEGGEQVALAPQEVVWNPLEPGSFSLALRPGREMAGFDHLEIYYGVVAAATRMKSRHRLTLQLAAPDGQRAEEACALSLAVLAMHRDGLMRQGACSWNAGGHQAKATLKSLKFASGAAPAAEIRTLELEAEVELHLERLLAEDEGTPILRILSPGAHGGRPIEIEAAVQA